MSNKIPEGAITNIKNITPGMMVKVKENPILHKCLSNYVYSEDTYVDVWGLRLAHEPGMEYYNDSKQGYEENASYDFAHVDSIEYAMPPIPPGFIAVVRRDGNITIVEVGE